MSQSQQVALVCLRNQATLRQPLYHRLVDPKIIEAIGADRLSSFARLVGHPVALYRVNFTAPLVSRCDTNYNDSTDPNWPRA